MTGWDWDIPSEGLVMFDILMPRAEFRPAGSIDGIPLVEHTCRRPGRVRGIAYVSAEPSADDDPYVVPFCGCRPLYRTKTGRLLTDDDIEALADEADQGA